ncbi:hypothetical protein SELMODRAFT_438189 [Selaginella moellendorffii]|uniref:Protein kinase domain-containing protein n=1 Tax=Selaginella moellendorffii TaxID=88036 RepID=D8QUW6_SELML|nr:hypothetical protein SELMODRAFT_438189 [Selaginella moellendorffii]
MAKVLLSALLFGLLLFVVDASRNTQLTGRESDVTYVIDGPREGNQAADLNVIIQNTPKHGLQDTYCCLRNGFGCVQECDSNIKYYCCLKNGFGCQQFCEENLPAALRLVQGTLLLQKERLWELHWNVPQNRGPDEHSLPCHSRWIVHWETVVELETLQSPLNKRIMHRSCVSIILVITTLLEAHLVRSQESTAKPTQAGYSMTLEAPLSSKLELHLALPPLGANLARVSVLLVSLPPNGRHGTIQQRWHGELRGNLSGKELCWDILESSGAPTRKEEEEISFLFLVNSSLEIHGTKGVMWSTPTIGDVTDQYGYQLLKIYSNGELHFTSRSFSSSNSTKSIDLKPATADRCLCPELKNDTRRSSSMQYVSSGDKERCRPENEPGRTCENSQHYYMLEATVRYFYKPLDLSSALHNVSSSVHGPVYQKRTRNVADQALLFSIKLYQAGDLPKLSAPGSSQNKVAKQQKKAKPAIVAAFPVATMAIVIIAMVIWKKQINSYLKHYKPSFPSGAMDVVRVFTYPELHTATKAFSKKIGSGGFGTVAVKRLESFSSQGYKQFKAEESHHFLVYEYVANGLLDKWIYKPLEELNWDTRFRIVEEIAQGNCRGMQH